MATIIRVVLELNTIIGFTCNLQFGVFEKKTFTSLFKIRKDRVELL